MEKAQVSCHYLIEWTENLDFSFPVSRFLFLLFTRSMCAHVNKIDR